MTETDFPKDWPSSVQDIQLRLTTQDELSWISGLRGLKSMIKAMNVSNEEEEQCLINLFENFLPHIEQIIAYV